MTKAEIRLENAVKGEELVLMHSCFSKLKDKLENDEDSKTLYKMGVQSFIFYLRMCEETSRLMQEKGATKDEIMSKIDECGKDMKEVYDMYIKNGLDIDPKFI